MKATTIIKCSPSKGRDSPEQSIFDHCGFELSVRLNRSNVAKFESKFKKQQPNTELLGSRRKELEENQELYTFCERSNWPTHM